MWRSIISPTSPTSPEPDPPKEDERGKRSTTDHRDAPSLNHDAAQPKEEHANKLWCGFTPGQLLLFVFSFSLGVMRYSIVSLPYIYLVNVIGMRQVEATMVCHANMACVYLSEVLAGVVSKTRLGVSKTLIVLSSLLFGISVVLMVSSWNKIAIRHFVEPFAVISMLFICLLLGGTIHCLRLTMLNEFNLPKEYPRFLQFKFFATECEYIGKTLGAFLVTGATNPGPSMLMSTTVWVASSSVIFAVSLVGPKVFQTEKDSRNIIGDFLKHTFYALKANLLNKQNTEKFSADDLERIKILHSATILYVPIIILIGLKDLKYSRYTWQSLELTLNINGVEMSPQKILVVYPLTVALILPITYYVINPYFKKKVASHKTRITTRAIVAFYFMAGSLAFATILQCRIEMGYRALDPQNETVSIFNFLPCNATVRVFCGKTTPNAVNSLEVTTIACPKMQRNFDAKVIQGKCVIDGMQRFFSVSVVFTQGLGMMMALGYDFRSDGKLHEINRSYPIYIQHVHYPTQQQAVGNRLLLLHNVMVNHTLVLVPAKLSKKKKWVPAGEPVYTVLLSPLDNSHIKTIHIDPGHYGIMLDNQITKMIDYQFSKTLAILVAHESHYHIKTKTVILSEKISISVLYQIPQALMSGLAEMVIESPGFVYGRKKIPIEWRDFGMTIWTFSCFLGNMIIVVATALLRGERNLLAFITGTAASVVSIALITIFLLDYFKADYVDSKRDD